MPPCLGRLQVAQESKIPPVMTTGKGVGLRFYARGSQPHSFGRDLARDPILCPDNGGKPGSDYWSPRDVRPAAPRSIPLRRVRGARTHPPLSGPPFRSVLVLFAACSFSILITRPQRPLGADISRAADCFVYSRSWIGCQEARNGGARPTLRRSESRPFLLRLEPCLQLNHWDRKRL